MKFPYNRVLIVGCGGAGKSTLARKMGELFDLPVVHLDKLFWLPNWVQIENSEFDKRLIESLNKPKWIVYGNYMRTIDMRLCYADLSVMLDMPQNVCIENVYKRYEQYKGRTRPDITEGCSEQIDDEFKQWILNYRSDHRDDMINTLRQSGKPYKVFQSYDAVDEWLDQFDRT